MEDELFKLLIDNAHEMIIVFDISGKILYANNTAKSVSEYGEGFVGISICEFITTEIFQEHGQLAFKFPLGNDMHDMNAYRRNRTCFPVKAKILKYNEDILFLEGYDASEEMFLHKKVSQVSEEAEAAMKVKSEFVANVTHELRTPVNGILGNTRELVELETDENKIRLLNLVERGCKDMNAIINNILDFSKLEAGKFSLEKREFDLYAMMDYIKSTHINKITEKGLDFEIRISKIVPQFVIGDELRIQQVINNLLSNACKFTSVGKITVEVIKTAYTSGRVELFFLVIDTGIGIDKNEKDKLFKSFSQVDASISRRFGGTGLGLNISKQLVEMMDGKIQVESEKNKGSMFSFSIWVDLPKTEEEKADSNSIQIADNNMPGQVNWGDSDIKEYGTKQNSEELKKKILKLSLAADMGNWEKAESFAESIKELTENAPREIKSAILRLKMAVQKADYDKTTAAYGLLKELLEITE